MRLCLFDIDGTLVNTSGAGRAALSRALDSAVGLPKALENIRLDGKTDQLIIREALERADRKSDPEALRRIFSCYAVFLEEELKLRQDVYEVLPGVLDLLVRLQSTARVLLGLATGNIEMGARAKLEPGGLNTFFPFGGFGSDSPSRTELIRTAIQRARALWAGPLKTFVIGDTPQDISHGKAAGASVIAVATGFYSVSDLQGFGPDWTLPDLAQTNRIAEYILSH